MEQFGGIDPLADIEVWGKVCKIKKYIEMVS